IKGEETELDKKVIDVIGEPLMHLIRNAVDHGIESEEIRAGLRKSEVATITLNAYQGGNQIFVEVSDDGKGLDVEVIKKNAIGKGMATSEMFANMDDEDIYNFVFKPGFSTAKVITDVSGRGVGMNVVKEIVNELNGSISIETEPGMGTRFVMSFPLTLAIIPAIMIRVAGDMYAVPLSDVIETIKISDSEITTIEGYEVINLRGEILSLLRLDEFVGMDSILEDGKKIPVVIVGYGNRKVGLLVDSLEGKQEIVIKSLEQNYTTIEGLAGASILGDGSICLILDTTSMINRVIVEQEYISKREKRKIAEIGEDSAEQAVKAKGIEEEGGDIRSIGVEGEEQKPDRAVKAVEDVKEDIIYEKEKVALEKKVG
ncbi:MAG: chemotaxis protein CheW, partial [Candidatus Altiarchaeales archaeon]|nr:chemotaxis protein CheW [Candidatus Altiarchaeales archaeon]